MREVLKIAALLAEPIGKTKFLNKMLKKPAQFKLKANFLDKVLGALVEPIGVF